MSLDIWYPFYVGDYHKKTLHLSTLEHGAYRLLMDAYWMNGGPITDDDGELASITKLSLSDWKAIRSRIARFFIQEGDDVKWWRHEWIDMELFKALKQKHLRSLGAMKTNEIRWGKVSHSDSLSESHSESQGVSQNGRSSPSPSQVGNVCEDEVLSPRFPATAGAAALFNDKIGCTRDFSDKVWNIAMARGQCDKNGRPIVSWEHFLAAAFTFDKENARGTTKHRGNSRPSDDRNRGTLNEGQAAQYRGVGQVD